MFSTGVLHTLLATRNSQFLILFLQDINRSCVAATGNENNGWGELPPKPPGLRRYFQRRKPMPTFIEYKLEDGTTILVQANRPAQAGGITKASRSDAVGNAINTVNQKFADAFAGVKKSAMVLRQQFVELQADEVEVTFGLTATGELGNFAIGQVGAEANYEITLKWSNKPDKA